MGSVAYSQITGLILTAYYTIPKTGIMKQRIVKVDNLCIVFFFLLSFRMVPRTVLQSVPGIELVAFQMWRTSWNWWCQCRRKAPIISSSHMKTVRRSLSVWPFQGRANLKVIHDSFQHLNSSTRFEPHPIEIMLPVIGSIPFVQPLYYSVSPSSSRTLIEYGKYIICLNVSPCSSCEKCLCTVVDMLKLMEYL